MSLGCRLLAIGFCAVVLAGGLARGDLSLYGWVYRIETGEVFAYDPSSARFLPLNDADGPAPYAMMPPLSCVVAS